MAFLSSFHLFLLIWACAFLITSVNCRPIRGTQSDGIIDAPDDASTRRSRRRQLMMDKQDKNKETPAPSQKPSATPTFPPAVTPTLNPSAAALSKPPSITPSPTSSTDGNNGLLSYRPGDFSNNARSNDGMLVLSNGLSCTRIATSGQPVALVNGLSSTELFHDQPDGAAVFEKDNGGWYYVSNSEIVQMGTCWNCGGVGAIEFNDLGHVVGYKRIVGNTRKNCGGGKSPWSSWITCEETKTEDYLGKVYQVDPTGERPHELTAFGELGMYESFAFDDSTDVPTFYVTRDDPFGVLTRFTPNAAGMECYNKPNDYDRWCTLNHGDIDYLVLSGPGDTGTFAWTTNETDARISANAYYPNSEGIDAADGKVFFVSKEFKRLVILDLAHQTYTYSSTASGAFENQPDQVGRLVKDDDESILYFAEDGGASSGVFGRNMHGNYFTVLEGRTDDEEDEATGLAWSPDALHMYVTYQQGGFVYDCTRDDNMPFHGATLDIKYHAV